MAVYGAIKYGTDLYGFTWTIPFFEICVDWQRTGSFDGPYYNITSEVRFVKWERGKDSELGTATAGKCELRLRNDDRKYSPDNAASPLYGYIEPGLDIRVRAYFKGTHNCFRGKLNRIISHPHWTKQDCYMYAVDDMSSLALADVETTLYENKSSGVVVDAVLDAAGYNSTRRNIAVGEQILPYAWFHDTKALQALQSLEDAENGFFWVDGRGYAIWEGGDYRTSGVRLTPLTTISDTMVDIAYDYDISNVVNEVKSRFTPRAVAGAVTDIWELEGTIELYPGDPVDVHADYQYPAKDVVTPVATTDYTANVEPDGGGADKTNSIDLQFSTKAQSAEIQLTYEA